MSVIDPQLPTQLAAKLARSLDERQIEYAIGEALALGYWISPRATLDVDLTLFMPHDQPSRCLQVLSDIGCQFDSADAIHESPLGMSWSRKSRSRNEASDESKTGVEAFCEDS